MTDVFYTKTIQFQDINYQLAQNEDKTAIFDGWCDFLNYFDSSVRFQFSFLNLSVSMENFEQTIFIPSQGDKFDDIRAEYATMLQNQLAKGNNGLTKTKYLTFGVEADSIKNAKPRLERVETDILNNFKRLGVSADSLNGKERLHLMHSIFHMDGHEKFLFEWDWLPLSGLSTKDFIAPSSFEFPDGRSFRMGGKAGAVSFLQILAPELNDRMLADFLGMESSLVVNMHVQSVDQTKAIKTIKRKITDLDKMKIEEQKKAVRSGYDMDIIPSDLATYGGEAKKLLQDFFRLVYEQAGCSKPVERLWISSMEESAIADGFRKLKSSKEYDNLYQSALCRAKADWLVGINMTRLFSVLYHQTLNVGRVMTPTLAMIVTREAAISAFKQEPFYNVVLDCGGFAVSGEKLKDKGEAERIAADCNGKAATVKSVERKDKTDKPPKLYDLTSLQRDANRLYGYTAQQTLDYAQSLYEKKLCTYPRTDSRYLTSDMADSTPVIINAAAMALPFARQFPVTCDMAQVIDNSKVSDHHAIIPTLSVKGFDLAALPAGERDILTLVIVRLVCAVGKPHRYAETTVSVECEGESFTAKGKSVIDKGWKAADTVFHANLRNKPDEEKEAALPSLSADQTFKPVMASVKEGKTSPPKHFTEAICCERGIRNRP